MKPRQLVTLIVSLAITAVFLYLALNRVDWVKLGHTLASANFAFIALSAVAMFFSYVLRTVRWRQFLAPTKKITVRRLFPVLIVGFALNNLLPARPGEFARGYWLGKREGISKTLGVATVIVERVADGFTLVGFLVAALLSFERLGLDLPLVAEWIAFAMTVIFGVALAGMIFLLVREELALRVLRWFTRFLPASIAARIETMLGSFVLGLHSLKSARDVFTIVLLSLVIWTLEAATYFFMLIAFGALTTIGRRAVAGVMTMAMINFGVMIPAAPGGVGPYEAAGIFALSAFGVDETTAAGVALVTHAIQFGMITGLGLLFIWLEGIKIVTSESDA